MKKLYINVDRCEVRGGAEALSPIVQEMDRRLQELASETEMMKEVLFKYASTNSSPQYEKCAVSVYNLSEFLFDASEQLNEMQTQIVKYQDAMARYNDKNCSFYSPNPHSVKKVQISQDSTNWQFTYDEMIHLNQSIEKYTRSARDILKQLQSNKESIGSIWRDPQYNDFSEFIDTIVSTTSNAITTLEEYSTYLGRKIVEMKNAGI